MEDKRIGPFSVILMLFLITFWGSSFVVVKLVLREGLTPVAIATFRFLLAGGLFLVAIVLNKARNRHYQILVDVKDIPLIVFLAFSGVTVFFIAQYTGIQMASASVASILVCLLSPILISVFSAYVFKEKLSRAQLLGIVIASIGTLAVVAGGAFNLQGNLTFFLGSMVLLSTPLLWAAYTLLGKKIIQKYDPFLVVAYINILGGLFLVPFSIIENSISTIFILTSQEWLAVLYLAFTCSLLGYFIWFHVIKRSSAAATSSFLFAEPLVTVLFAAAFVREEITIFTIGGGLLIFIGVFLITTRRRASFSDSKQ
jgi:drug/metabolite transporter (DMT)-like permease